MPAITIPYTYSLSVSSVGLIKKWLTRFWGGFFIWLLAIVLGLVALKGNLNGFASKAWLRETGLVYLVWGFLNYIIFFTVFHFVIPWGLKTKRYVWMVLFTYLLILLVGIVKYVIGSLKMFDYIMVSFYVEGDETRPVYYTFGRYLLKTIFTGTFVSLLGYSAGLTFNWFKSEKTRKELDNKRMAAELSFLRMQINPHFLFNSLNSIYSLTLKKSADAPEAVLKLSELMRYMLYEREDDRHKVPLEKEIAYLENFIAFQQIRFRQSCVEFLKDGSFDNVKIVPLLLVPFLENAFKHGVLSDEQHPLQIHLIVEGNRLIFSVKNKKNIQNKDITGGVGLDNVQKRLDLLYPNQHQLTITDTTGYYQSELMLLL